MLHVQIDHGGAGCKHGRPIHHHHALRGRRAFTKQWSDGKGGANALLWRLFDMLRLIQSLYGGALPDDDEGRSYLHLIAHTIWSGCKEPVMLLRRIVPKVAPWADVDALLDETAERWARRPVPYSARQAGKIIKLTDDERTRARAWRIKPVDKTDRQLVERQKRKRRARAKKRRLERKLAAAPVADVKPTSVLVDEIMAAEGCSRSTAYRRIKAGGEVRVPLTESRPWIEAGFNCRRTWERHGKPCRKRETRPVAARGKNPTNSKRSSPSCRNSETKRVPDIHLLSSSNKRAATSSVSRPAPRRRQNLAAEKVYQARAVQTSSGMRAAQSQERPPDKLPPEFHKTDFLSLAPRILHRCDHDPVVHGAIRQRSYAWATVEAAR